MTTYWTYRVSFHCFGCIISFVRKKIVVVYISKVFVKKCVSKNKCRNSAMQGFKILFYPIF